MELIFRNAGRRASVAAAENEIHVYLATGHLGSFTTGRGLIIMANSDNDWILNEIINSVATVYHSKGFYEPEVKKH